MNKNFFINIFEKIKENKYLKIIILIFLVLIILFYCLVDLKKKDSDVVENDYVSNMEEKLESIIKNIDGAGQTKVMITVDGGNETVLATNTSTKETKDGKEISETPLIVNGKTIVLKEKNPMIQGVLIVCEGAKKIAVVNSIIDATTSLLNIDCSKIQVVKMK